MEKAAPAYVGRRVTREQYLDLPDDGFRYEMVDGVLQMSPSADSTHSRILVNLVYELRRSISDRGSVFVELDVLLPDGGDVLRPDLCYVAAERGQIILAHIHGAPDIVAEILSPCTRARDLGPKSERYRSCGVREFWVVDPENSSVEVRLNLSGSWQISGGGRSEVLPGFVLSPGILQ